MRQQLTNISYTLESPALYLLYGTESIGSGELIAAAMLMYTFLEEKAHDDVFILSGLKLLTWIEGALSMGNNS